MLKRLHLQNFTVFAAANFEFGPGLNVLVGTNGTGKSHVLKLGYAVLKGLRGQIIESVLARGDSAAFHKAVHRQRASDSFFVNNLLEIFRPVPFKVSELVRKGSENGCIIEFELYDKDLKPGNYKFDLVHASEMPLVHVPPSPLATPPNIVDAVQEQISSPIFIPAKEVLTLSWIIPATSTLILPVDETYIDILTKLSYLPLRNPQSIVQIVLKKLTQILGGEIEQEGNNFYLISPYNDRMEVNMVAEGLRKFGILQRLLVNGSLSTSATLFWDEPEANLNPVLLRQLAAILAELASQGFQIILATHSTDLLKEFHILSRQKDAQPLPIKYFGLNAEAGEATRVVATDNFEYLPDVVALAEELKQADELEEIFIRDDREYYANNRGEE
jgi:AAA15 family ATPase/GTPase